MLEYIKQLYGSKKEYKVQMERVKQLPEDYQFVFDKMQTYMWSLTGGDGLDLLQTQCDLIDLFEMSVLEEMGVLEVTGEDVAGFCDELMRDHTLWMNRQREKLNKRLQKRLQN